MPCTQYIKANKEAYGQKMTGLDVLNITYLILNLLTVILCISFLAVSPGDIQMADIMTLDPTYGNFLTDVVFNSNAPSKLALQTIAVYTTMTDTPVSKNVYFGMSSSYPYQSLAYYASLFASSPVIFQLQNAKFSGTSTSETLTLASPLWAYQHNLQLLDPSKCTAAATADNLGLMTLPDPDTVLLSGLSGATRTCVFASPTTANYQRCYDDVSRHQSIVAFHVITSLIGLAFYVYYLWRQSIVPPGHVYYDNCVSQCEQCIFVTKLLVVTLFIAEIAHGIPAISAESSECPNKLTGLLSLYQIFVACCAFLLVSTLLLLSKDCVAPYINKIMPAPTVEAPSDEL